MKIEKFKTMLEDSLNSLDKNIKTLVSNSYTDTVIKNVKKHGKNAKLKLTRQYNKLNSDLQLKVKGTYNDFITRCDDIITKAIYTIKLNANTLRLYSYDLYNEMIDKKQ